eukprot:190536_1
MIMALLLHRRALTFIYVATTMLLWSLTECATCFECFNAVFRKTRIQSISNTDNCFDNCLNTQGIITSDSNSTQLPSPQSLLLSTMLFSRNGSDTQSIAASIKEFEFELLNLPDNVTWFKLDSDYTSQNSTHMNRLLLSLIIYDITHTLFFIGHYLPFNASANARQFQIIFDYFSQFQSGVRTSHLRSVILNFESIRKKVIDFQDLPMDEPDVDIPHHLFDFHAKPPLSAMSRHRMLMRRVQDTPRVKDMNSDRSSIKYFWNTDWVHWHKAPLQFIGLNPKETRKQIHTLLWRVCMEMDKMNKIITDRVDAKLKVRAANSKRVDFGSAKMLMVWRKTTDLFLKNFFRGAESTRYINIIHFQTIGVMRRVMRLTEKQKKLLHGLSQSFQFDTLKFILSSAVRRQKHHNLKIRVYPRYIKNGEIFLYQMQFESGLLGGAMGWRREMIMTHQFLIHLWEAAKIGYNLKFSEIQQCGFFSLMNVVLQFAAVGGRCGFAYNEKDKGFEASIVCQISILDINEEGVNPNMEKHLKMPRKFLKQLNDTDEDLRLWGVSGVMTDVTGLDYGDIQKDSSGSGEDDNELEAMDTLFHIPRRRDGIRVADLQSHNKDMEIEDMKTIQ